MASDRCDPDQPRSVVPTGGELSLSKDEVFHILQNPRRRAVLRYLLEHDDREQFTLSDLAEEIAAWEHDTTVRDLTSDQRQRVYIALYQSHLPKLDEEGVIEFNQARGTIRPVPLLRVLDPYLENGLHGATDRLTVADHATETPDTTDEPRSTRSFTAAFSDLFRR